jgi:hypothetical protein
MRRHLKFAATAASIVVASMAFGQLESKPLDATPTDIQVRGGIFIPLDSNLRKVSDNFFAIGVDIIFQQQYIANSSTYLSIDWLGKSLSGEKGNVFPICINQKFYGKSEGNKNTYAFVGIGATVFDVVSTNTVFGARAGLGMDLGESIFVEGTFFWSDRSTGNVYNIGTGFYLGYRW